MVPYGAVLHGGNAPALAAGDGGGYEKRVLIPLFLASAFLFFVAYQLFGVGAAAGVMALFLVLIVASHCVRVSRDFPFLHISPHRADAVGGGGGGLRRTDGMGAGTIAALPAAFGYKWDRPGTRGWAQCAICLGLVRVGEAVRRLPACGHLFHAGCIDKWLHAHATCPLPSPPPCRSGLPDAGGGTVPSTIRS